jgi:ATP-binding cassette subfamily C protein
MRQLLEASGLRRYGALVLALSGLVNLLALAGAIYMLQVYDRVLTSQSVPTLVALSLLIGGAYLAFGVLDLLRGQILIRVGLNADRLAAPAAHRALIAAQGESAVQPMKDADALRGFLASPAPIALVDLAWVPLFLAFLLLVSPPLAALTAGGIAVLVAAALLFGVALRAREADAAAMARHRLALAEGQLRNAGPLLAMGRAGAASEAFARAHAALVAAQARHADLAGALGALGRVLRLALQSAIVGTGAYLAIHDQLTAGAIIAASVAAQRALAPIESAIGAWPACRAAWRGAKRLAAALAARPAAPVRRAPMAALGSLELKQVSVVHPAAPGPALAEVSFALAAGEAVLVLGRSGAGKSTLIAAIAGLARLSGGAIHVDGWRRADDASGPAMPAVGYLPQDATLPPGTVAEAIAFLGRDADAESVRRAAALMGVHEPIEALPEGYVTRLDRIEPVLTPGMRQRLALARAFHGEPALILLDDPASHLDAAGEAALIRAIRAARQRGAIVVVTATRTALMPAVDRVAVLEAGRLAGFGEKTRVLTALRDRREAANANNLIPRREAHAS